MYFDLHCLLKQKIKSLAERRLIYDISMLYNMHFKYHFYVSLNIMTFFYTHTHTHPHTHTHTQIYSVIVVY